MARMDDNSPHCERWTNRKLMLRVREVANLESFDGVYHTSIGELNGDNVRKATHVYRETWLTPVLDEIERRFVK